MRSTLFFIPHEIAGLPLFGVGLLLGCLVIAMVGWIAWTLATKGTANDVLKSLPLFGMAAAIVIFVLPAVEQKWPDGTPIGLPIRGYGVMVLTGLVIGIAITVYRGKRLGIEPDTIVGLGFWMMLTGVLGARIFYVVQKWQEFNSIPEIFQLTEGGLVIYGGVVGGLIAGAVYCLKHQLKILAMADLIAPGFLIGLCFGRLGCLLHGCCFGGVCEVELPMIRFPHGSVPFQAQLATGELLGIKTESGRVPRKIVEVDAGSAAEKLGIQPTGYLESILFNGIQPEPGSDPTAPLAVFAEVTVDGQRFTFLPSDLPALSLPTHPSQIYSAINALLLCGLIWFLQPIPSRDGVTFCVAILLYALSRFLLEGVRSDEAGQLGTALTVAQWVALISGVAAIAGIALIGRLPKTRSWTWNAV